MVSIAMGPSSKVLTIISYHQIKRVFFAQTQSADSDSEMGNVRSESCAMVWHVFEV